MNSDQDAENAAVTLIREAIDEIVIQQLGGYPPPKETLDIAKKVAALFNISWDYDWHERQRACDGEPQRYWDRKLILKSKKIPIPATPAPE